MHVRMFRRVIANRAIYLGAVLAGVSYSRRYGSRTKDVFVRDVPGDFRNYIGMGFDKINVHDEALPRR